MQADHERRATRCIVRGLALRSMEALGVKLTPWQLRWALEPVLSDSTVAIADEVLMAEAASARVPCSTAAIAAKPADGRPVAVAASRRVFAVDSKGERAY
jgi:hypothetical protein